MSINDYLFIYLLFKYLHVGTYARVDEDPAHSGTDLDPFCILTRIRILGPLDPP